MTEPTNSTPAGSDCQPPAPTDEQANGRADTTINEQDGKTEARIRTSGSSEFHASWYRNGMMRREIRATMQEQVDWLREINEKTLGMLRFNAMVLGLLVPSLSFAVEFQLVPEMAAFHTIEMTAGVATLVTSTAIAGVTYTSSSMEVGVSDADVETAARRGLTDAELHDEFVRSYADWVESNRRTLRRNSALVTATVALSVTAITLLSLGFAVALFEPFPGYAKYVTYIGLALLLVGSQYF